MKSVTNGGTETFELPRKHKEDAREGEEEHGIQARGTVPVFLRCSGEIRENVHRIRDDFLRYAAHFPTPSPTVFPGARPAEMVAALKRL